MSGQDNAGSRTQGCFDHTDNIGDTQTGKERPQRKVLESCRAGWEVVNQRIIFHVDSDEVVQTRRGECKDSRDFFSMEEIGGFVPVLVSHVSLSILVG